METIAAEMKLRSKQQEDMGNVTAQLVHCSRHAQANALEVSRSYNHNC